MFTETLVELDSHHWMVQYFQTPNIGLEGFVVFHNNRVPLPSFGATRMLPYASRDEMLRDALELSKAMTYKLIFAGYQYGGAKVALKLPQHKKRKEYLRAYAKYIDTQKGTLVTGTDVGMTQDDLMYLAQKTQYVVGTRVDPAYYTALGVYFCIRESLREIFGTDVCEGKCFAVQGLGKVGFHLVRLLANNNAKIIFVSDIDNAKMRLAQKQFINVRGVPPCELYNQRVDIFSPCSPSEKITYSMVSRMQCKAIVGGANNQLANSGVAYKLHSSGIIYAPDFITNAGGVISVIDEYEHRVPSRERITECVTGIRTRLRQVFKKSGRLNKPPFEIANEIVMSKLYK